VRNQRAERNPTRGVRPLKLNNVRDRVLSREEYDCLITLLPAYLQPAVSLAYYTGMRKGEILNLTWDQVDLREGFIHLEPEDTKTQEGRDIPLNGELMAMLQAMPRGLPGVHVFSYNGQPIKGIKRSFKTACKNAGIENFTFHDLRHTAINNWRLAGHDYFRIMAASGHKTMSVFKRYNTVSREELKALVGRNSDVVDTNMDTNGNWTKHKIG
jgi:integrase